MALLQNITINAQYPVRACGGAGGNERSQSGQRQDTHFNKYFSNVGITEAIPSKAWPPYTWGISIDEKTPTTLTWNIAAALALKIVIYPATFTISSIFVPAATTATRLSIIRFNGYRPRVEFVGRRPNLKFTGTGGE